MKTSQEPLQKLSIRPVISQEFPLKNAQKTENDGFYNNNLMGLWQRMNPKQNPSWDAHNES